VNLVSSVSRKGSTFGAHRSVLVKVFYYVVSYIVDILVTGVRSEARYSMTIFVTCIT
jgi:hypothetical protein